jgi:hypothetical protein
MADSYISGSEPDKKLQTYLNTVGGQQVHSEAVTPTDPTGVPFGASNPQYAVINDGAITPKAVTANSSGTTIIVTPSSGKSIRLWWYNISASPDNSASVTAGLRFTSGGTDFFNDRFSQYGGKNAHSFKAGRSYYQGGVNQSLYVNLDSAQTVFVNVDYEEI